MFADKLPALWKLLFELCVLFIFKEGNAAKGEHHTDIMYYTSNFQTAEFTKLKTRVWFCLNYYNVVSCSHTPSALNAGAKRSAVPYGHDSILLLGEGSEATEPYNNYANLFK